MRLSSYRSSLMNAVDIFLRIGLAIRFMGWSIWFRAMGVRLKVYVWMLRVSIPRNWRDILISSDCSLDDGVVLLATGPSNVGPKISIGSGTYINRFTMIDASDGISIGANC